MGEGETLSRASGHPESPGEKRMELNVVKVYAEVVSGESIDARPQMQECSVMWRPVSMMASWSLKWNVWPRGDTSDQGRVAKTLQVFQHVDHHSFQDLRPE